MILLCSVNAGTVPTSVGYNSKGKPIIKRDGKFLLAKGVTYHVMDHEKSWATDLKKMKEAMINTIRIDFGWNNIEKKDNEFDFSKLDKFISLAESKGFYLFISLAPNSHTRWLPEWMVEGPFKDKEWHLMDQKGEIAPGGWWAVPSPANETYLKYFKRYQSRVIEHIKTRSGILGYLLYNETHFPGGGDDPWCDYNPDAVKKFQKWLGKKYQNNISDLNKRWKTSYKGFSDVKPITDIPGKWQDLLLDDRGKLEDWRLFSSRLWVDFVNSLIDNARIADPEHVLMVTDMPWWFWGEGPKGGVIPGIFEKADIIGIDIYPSSDPHDQDTPAAVVNMLMSLYKNKKAVWLSEINEKNGDPSSENLNFHIKSSFEQGATGVLFFEWSDEGKDKDGGSYGLMKDEDTENPEYGYFKKALKQLDAHASEYLQSSVPEPVATIIWSENNMIQTYGDIRYAYDVRGAYSLLAKYNSSLNVITEEMFLSNGYRGNLPLLIPSMLFLKEGTSRKIDQFVRNGGDLFIDAGYSLWLDTPSGVKRMGEKRSLPGLSLRIIKAGDVKKEKINIKKNYYHLSDVSDKGWPAHTTGEVLLPIGKNEIIGSWKDPGETSILINNVGRGRLLYAGSKVLDGCLWEIDAATLNFYSRILASFIIFSGKATPDLLEIPRDELTLSGLQEGSEGDRISQDPNNIDRGQFSFIKLPYNQDFISFSSDYHSGTGYDLPGDEMPVFGRIFECIKHDTEFLMIDATDKKNTMECQGQKLLINSSKYTRIHILGCSHNKAEESEIVVKYSNPEKVEILPFFMEDWWGGCNINKPGEHCAFSFSQHNEEWGPKSPEVHLVHKVIDLSEYNTLEWIKFPYNPKFRILAVSMEKKSYFIQKKK